MIRTSFDPSGERSEDVTLSLVKFAESIDDIGMTVTRSTNIMTKD